MIPAPPESLEHVSRETSNLLKVYQALLHKWQKAVNLVAPSTIDISWERHFEDSLQIFPIVSRETSSGKKTLYDLGSGAGFPGLVLAITCPQLSVTLIESDQKKCAFLSTVSHETKTAIGIENCRIESAVQSLPAPDIVTARALATLPDLLNYIRPWVEKKGDILCIFPKGANWAAEVEAGQKIANFTLEDVPSKTDPAARLLVLRGIVFI